MPFAKEFDWLFAGLLAPTLRELGFEAIRADTVLDQQNILRDIVAGIHSSDLIVADITSLNPNVMYELGLAHGLRRPTIILTQSVESAPFDLRGYRMIPYTSHFDDANALISRLRQIASALNTGEIEFGSPVVDFIPIDPGSRRIAAGLEATLSSESEILPAGFLDHVEQIYDSIAVVNESATALTQSTVDFAQDIKNRTEQAQSIPKGDPSAHKKLRSIAYSASQVIDRWTNDTSLEAEKLAKGLIDLEVATDGVIQFSVIRDDNDLKEMTQFSHALQDFDQTLDDASTGVEQMRDAMAELPKLSRDLGRVVPKSVGAANRVLESFLVGRAFSARAIDSIEEKIEEYGQTR
jgi:hypothetical protein